MAIWLTSGAEVLLQMMTGLGLYRYVYGEREEKSYLKQKGILLLIAIYILQVYNSRFCIFSIFMTWNFTYFVGEHLAELEG